jgi:hypothetical protein
VNCERIQELVPKVVDRQALDWEISAVGEHVTTCAGCASLKSDLIEIGALVREPIRREVAEADFSKFWQAVERGIDRLPAPARAIRERVSAWLMVSRLAAVAAVAASLVLALYVPIQRPHGFAANDNRVDVQSAEGGADDTVLIDTDDQGATFIWVIPETYEEKQPS